MNAYEQKMRQIQRTAEIEKKNINIAIVALDSIYKELSESQQNEMHDRFLLIFKNLTN
jgi:hypothetical protein